MAQLEMLAKEWTLPENLQDQFIALIFEVYEESTESSWENGAMVCRNFPAVVPSHFLESLS